MKKVGMVAIYVESKEEAEHVIEKYLEISPQPELPFSPPLYVNLSYVPFLHDPFDNSNEDE